MSWCSCSVHPIEQLIMFTQRGLVPQRQLGNTRPDKVKGHGSPGGQSRVSGGAGSGLGWREKVSGVRSRQRKDWLSAGVSKKRQEN